MSSLPNIDQNTNTTHGTQGGEGGEGGIYSTDTAKSVHSLDSNDEEKDVTLGGGGEVCSNVNDDINRDTYNDNDMEAGDYRDGGNGEDSEEEISTNEKLGKRNEVLYSRAKDDLLLSLAICCHFNHLTLPKQYKRLFTQSDNITPEMIIKRFNLSNYDIERFHQYLKGNPRRHTHDNNSTDDEAYDVTNNVSTNEVDDIEDEGNPRRHTHDNNSTVDEAYDVTNNVSTNEVDDIEDAKFEVEVMELDSNSNAYTDHSTHTSNDDAAREQEYIEMSKKVSVLQHL
jgi:hypothetical protein